MPTEYLLEDERKKNLFATNMHTGEFNSMK